MRFGQLMFSKTITSRLQNFAPRAVVLATAFIVFTGASTDSCGGTTEPKSYIDESCPGGGCDTQVNPAPAPGSSLSCGNQPGQCPCDIAGGYGFCGMCSSNPPSMACQYCPAGTYCPADSCGGECLAVATSHCPANAPIDCGNGSCCPSGYPVCCATNHLCGTDQSACDNAAGSSSGGGGGSSGCGLTQCPPGETN